MTTRERLVTVELPYGGDINEHLRRLQDIGCRVIDHEAIVQPIDQTYIEDTYPDIECRAFQRFATTEGNLSNSWPTRLWYSLKEALDHRYIRSAKHTNDWLNMNDLRDRVRRMEKGERVFLGLGKITWNVVAMLNNKHETNFKNLILPWEDKIHPFLTYGAGSKAASHISAIQKLNRSYLELEPKDMCV